MSINSLEDSNAGGPVPQFPFTHLFAPISYIFPPNLAPLVAGSQPEMSTTPLPPLLDQLSSLMVSFLLIFPLTHSPFTPHNSSFTFFELISHLIFCYFPLILHPLPSSGSLIDCVVSSFPPQVRMFLPSKWIILKKTQLISKTCFDV